MSAQNKHTLLCLGDSYTIGEAVEPKERFANQAIELLKKDGIEFQEPRIIAKTGWTTDELAQAIKEETLTGKFDFVTLLIGVNNQYRERDLENYREEFNGLLNTAIRYTDGNKKHVIVISIPDWSATNFISQDSKRRTRQQVALEIDAFNAINKQESSKHGVHYIDITHDSRKATDDRELVASDGLHPSAKMYAEWAILLAEKLKSLMRS